MKTASILGAASFLFQAVIGNETEVTKNKSRYPRHQLYGNKAEARSNHDIDSSRKLDDLDLAPGAVTRIIGGIPVCPKNKYPFMVYVCWCNWSAICRYSGCGGTLVAPNVVLTAAHCGPMVFVKIGLYDLADWSEAETFTVVEHLPHPNHYNSYSFDYQLLRLSGNSSYEPVVLDNGEVPLTAGDDAIAIGWGDTNADNEVYQSSNILLEVELDIDSREVCDNAHGRLSRNSTLCASRDGKDACQGDSGGPLIDKATMKQIGITSFGKGCAIPGSPGAYAKVQDQICWINENIARFSAPNPAPTPTPDWVCDDYSNWADLYGDTCAWYEANEQPGCGAVGHLYDGGAGTAQEACCYCGGGNHSPPCSPNPVPPTPPPTPLSDQSQCYEVPRKRYNFVNVRGEIKSSKCNRLAILNQNQISDRCEMSNPTEGFIEAKIACPVTCQQCGADGCYEKGNDKFFWRTRRNKSLTKSCLHLKRRMNNMHLWNEEKVAKFCNRSTPDETPNGNTACPISCGAC